MTISKSAGSSTLVPYDFFEALPFWNELKKDEQNQLVSETQGLRGAAVKLIENRLAMGLHLYNIRGLLEGSGNWTKFMHNLRFSVKTAQRLISRYEVAREQLAPAILEAAAARGIDLLERSTPEAPLGPYTEGIKALPAPAADGAHGAQKVQEWLDKVVELRSKPLRRRQRRRDPLVLQRNAWRATVAAWRAVPGGKTRQTWAVQLLARLMAEMGLPAQKIEPEAVPTDFRPAVGYPKGRPRKKQK